MDFMKSETKINLMKAFAGESQARNRYNISAQIAKSEGYNAVSDLFNVIASQEQQHAKVFYDFLKETDGEKIQITADFPVNNSNTIELLKSAISNELDESDSIYKNFSEIASKEGFTEISKRFSLIAKIEKRHAELYEKFKKLIESDNYFSGGEKTVWICQKCGSVTIGKNPPKNCPVCGHPFNYIYKSHIFDLNSD